MPGHNFPSGHALFAGTFTASVWSLLNPAARSIAVFVVWVAGSRIELGLRFPVDVVAGAVLAVAIVAVCFDSCSLRPNAASPAPYNLNFRGS